MSSPFAPLHGLVAATHSPFHPDGSLRTAAVEAQAAHLLRNGVTTAFVNGTTGECSSLTVNERLALAERWLEVVRGTPLRVVVHTGANCLRDTRALAAHAQKHGAAATAAFPPSYFRPASVNDLVACSAEAAAGAPDIPFYYYDIPSMTGVAFPMIDFLTKAADAIPNLAGFKCTNPDLAAYQSCLRAGGGRWDIPFGVDEQLLGALATGARGAVGSGFNFAAPIYRRLFDAFAKGDFEAAREEQFRGIRVVARLADSGYMGSAKAVMAMLGVDVGPARLPNATPNPAQTAALRADLEAIGFFGWIA